MKISSQENQTNQTRTPKKEPMKFDIQVPLTAPQFNRLKAS